jgi:hypothetical protein
VSDIRRDKPTGAAEIAARILRSHIGRTETYATFGARAGLDAVARQAEAIGAEIATAICADNGVTTPKLTTGDRFDVPASALGLDVPADAPRMDYVVTAVDSDSFQLSVPSGDRGITIPCAGSCAGVVDREVGLMAIDHNKPATDARTFQLGTTPAGPSSPTVASDLAAIESDPDDRWYSMERWQPIWPAEPCADARTELPGQPVRYQPTTPTLRFCACGVKLFYSDDLRSNACSSCQRKGGIMLGAPIPAEPPAHVPELSPIPPAGFYWARLDVEDRLEPVEVLDNGVRAIVGIGGRLDASDVIEWGPALYPPGSGVALDESADKCTGCAVPIHRGNSVNHVGDRPWHTQCLVRSLTADVEALQKRYDERKAQRLTYVEAQLLKGALGAALLPAPFGGEPEVSRKLTGEEHAALEAAVSRATIQPAECRHDAWEWPMTRCPSCGMDER